MEGNRLGEVLRVVEESVQLETGLWRWWSFLFVSFLLSSHRWTAFPYLLSSLHFLTFLYGKSTFLHSDACCTVSIIRASESVSALQD